jgi:hypothetical protein
MRARSTGVILSLALAVTLSGCAGSGAAPGEGSDAYNISPTSLAFAGRGGGPRPASQDVQVTSTGSQIYLKTEVSGAAVESAVVTVTGSSTAVVTVQGASPIAVPTGTSTATVKIIGCADPVCSSEVAGSPKTVAVTYVKTDGGLTGSPGALTFTQPFGGAAPASQSVALEDVGGGSFAWSSSVSYQSGSGWLTVSPQSGAALPATALISVTPPAAGGTYQATVQFAVGSTSVFPVTVTYSVKSAFQVSPSSFNVVGAFGVATPDQQLSLQDTLGGSYPWTVEFNYDPSETTLGWATISAASGSALPAGVTLSLGSLPDRLTHSGYLRVTGAGASTLIPLSYRTP